jgi:hypothetical protein
LWVATLGVIALGNCAATPQGAGPDALSPFFPPLARAPLDTPLVVNGGFCEYRQGHFHAGLDFGTGRVVGKPVYAPLGGWIERVRSSGVGYGRSIYLHTDDDRLLVFAHLDAFDEPLASWVAWKQDSSGQYEHDLWPERERFPVRSGQRLGWTGESGAGGPHFHFEIRRGDMALNPLRAGLPIADGNAPSIASVTLEPLDERSYVAGAQAPYTLVPRQRPDTVKVAGRLRVTVGARDGIWSGVDRMVPWSVSMTAGGERVEARFDSVSWATDMAEGDHVYDVGRVTGGYGVTLWAPPGFRPRVLLGGEPTGEVGTVEVDPTRAEALTVEVRAADLGGNVATARIVLVPDREVVGKHEARAAEARARPISSTEMRSVPFSLQLAFSSLPAFNEPVAGIGGGSGGVGMRIAVRGARAAECTDIELGGERAVLTGRGDSRVAVVTPPAGFSGPLWIRGGDGSSSWKSRGPELSVRAASAGSADSSGDLSWTIPPDGLFEPAVFVVERAAKPKRTEELEPLGEAWTLHPRSHPLRKVLTLRLRLPGAAAPAHAPPADAGLYREGSDGWELIRSRFDAAGRFFEGETRRIGRFALFRDVQPPRIARLAPARKAPAGPYNRWALEARITEDGSGLDGRASGFIVDGKRVPSEWDAEERVLRWRPLTPPRAGRHRYEVAVQDRAGNAARAGGTFVLD